MLLKAFNLFVYLKSDGRWKRSSIFYVWNGLGGYQGCGVLGYVEAAFHFFFNSFLNWEIRCLWPQNPVDESEVRGREQFVHVVNGFVLFQPLAGRVESGDRLGSRYGGTLSRGRQQWTHWRGVIHLSDTKERPHCTLQCHDWWQALTNLMYCTTNYLEKYFTQMERRKPAKTRPDANVVWWFFFYFHFLVWTKFVIWSGGCRVREYRN